MLKFTKYILGATLVCFSTLTVVYAALPKESSPDKSDFVSRLSGQEVKSNEKSELLLAKSPTKDYIDIAQDVPPTLATLDFSKVRYQSRDVFEMGAKLQNIDLPSSIWKQAEKPFKFFASLVTKVVVYDSSLKKASESFAIIPVGYTMNAQSPQQRINNPPFDSIYADTRIKMTHLKTFLDMENTIKNSGNSMNLDFTQIYNKTHTQLKENIKNLSNNETLVQEFDKYIPPKSYLTKEEIKDVDSIRKRIIQVGNITPLVENVSEVMLIETNSREWAKQIAQQVLEKQAIPALW